MKAVTVGSAMIDMITIVDPENIERMTLRNEGKSFLWLEAGRKIPAKSITSHVGGGACNTAVSMARRGWQVAALAKTGADLNAEAVREHLAGEHVLTDRMLMQPGLSTGVSSIIASHERNATIFVHRGANETITDEEASQDFTGVDLVYIAPLSSGSADCFPTIAARAKAAGAMVAANPGIRQLTSRTEAFFEALPNVDLLSVNEVEAAALVPGLYVRNAPPPRHVPEEAPPLIRAGLSFGGFHMGLLEFLEAMRAMGPRYVLVTDGSHGAYLAGPEGVIWCASAPAQVAGTTGAGDAYCSTLCAALAEGVAPDESMLQAAVNAASVVEHVDTTTGLLDREALARRVEAARGQVRMMRF